MITLDKLHDAFLCIYSPASSDMSETVVPLFYEAPGVSLKQKKKTKQNGY